MKHPSLGLLAGGAIALAALTLVAIGAPFDRPPPAAAPAPAEPPPPSVSAGGITLASTTIDLPADDQSYPAGPHADLVNARCSACHSASMVLSQPRLTADQWKGEVAKMREVYKAPVPESDTAAIVDYLTALPGQGVTPPR